MFIELVQLQDRLGEIMKRAEAILAAREGCDVAALRDARSELVGALRDYQQFKHDLIFEPCAQRGGYRGRQAQRIERECLWASEEFRACLLRWSALSQPDCWAENPQAVLEMLARLRPALVRDRIEIAELLEVRLAA